MIWSPIDIAEELHKNGITGRENRAIFIAVIGGETAGSFDDKLIVVNEGGTAPGSRDRGLLAINDHWHPEVSDECALDGACAIKEGVRIYRERSNTFTAWNAYKNKLHEKYLPMARVAVEAALRVRQAGVILAQTEQREVDALSALSDMTDAWNKALLAGEALEAMNDALRRRLDVSNGVVDRFYAWVEEIKGGPTT